MTNKLLIAAERVTGSDEFERYLEIARQRKLGVEVQEFYLPDLMWGNWQARLDQYKILLQDFQGELAIHNAFRMIDHLGLDPDVLELTKKKYDFIFMIAKELGCKTIVSHFTWNPFVTDVYLYRWQEEETKFWDSYVNLAEKEGITIAGENTAEPRPEIIKPIIDKLNSERFKLNLDVGHFNLHSQASLEDWLLAFGSDISYMHIHNNYKNYDAHNPVSKGTFNFDYLFKLLDKFELSPTLTTEIYSDELPESLDYLQAKIAMSRAYQATR